MGWGESGFNCWGVILVLYECIWNALMVSLVLPSFDNTGSLGYPPYQVVYPPGSTLGDCLLFSCEEHGGWVKTYHFLFTSTFSCFPVFPLLMTPQIFSTFECSLLGLLNNNNNNNPQGCKKNRLTIWSLHVIGGDWMVQSSWVGDPLPASFF